MAARLSFFATAPRGMERLLAEELRALGASEVGEARAGVSFWGDLETAYRACLWSRVASRVLLSLARFPAPTPEALYEGVQTIRWDDHLSPDGSLAVDLSSAQSGITHTHYGALKVKDAIVDRFRDAYGVRPSVDLRRPDVRIHVYLYRDEARVSLDLSGDSLHRRAYREEGVLAPLKENLAAAILLRARWSEIARAGGPLLDPMCGSGTLPIEAAWIAGDVAPGLLRPYFGFMGWKGHDATAWDALLKEARARRKKGMAKLPAIVGTDMDPGAVRSAIANVERAGLCGLVHIERRALRQAASVRGAPGLLVANPPYGERMGDEKRLGRLYAELGEVLKGSFAGWRAAVFTGNPGLVPRIRLRPRRSYNLYNGAIACKLLVFKLAVEGADVPRDHAFGGAARGAQEKPLPVQKSPQGEMLGNRLRKNRRHLGRWARRSGISCYRVYDADLPEYALAVDVYQGEKVWAHVQGYEAPTRVDPAVVEARRQEALAIIPEVLDIPQDQLFFKVRRRQRGKVQYEKLAGEGKFYEVREGDCRFRVNFTDYLDTGLFLDHRLTRERIRQLAGGRRFLNLFGYTGAATVHAAAGGALSTTTVDMSNTYLAWARRNLALNGFDGEQHTFVQADCLTWLHSEARYGSPRRRYGLIFLDPPTFSNSKRMRRSFDVQRDHAGLIAKTAQLLEPGGVLIFSTNRRGFKMAFAAREGLEVVDVTRKTLPRDFARNPQVHCCFEITRTGVRAARRSGRPS